MTVATEVLVAEVIGQDQDHVGLACYGADWVKRANGKQGDEKC